MLKRPTLLVIGAGAGADLGMPMGRGLSDTIANYVGNLEPKFHGANEAQVSIKRAASERGVKREEFFEVGAQIAQGVRRLRSIDNYVDSFQHDERISIIAKIAIVHAIVIAESDSHLAPGEDGQYKQKDTIERSWLEEFFHLLIHRHKANEVETILDRLMIINFNYDRCIEHFLLNELSRIFQHNAPVYYEKLLKEKLEIVHPYGYIGNLPWQASENAIEFGVGRIVGDPLKLANGIKTYSERVDDEITLKKLRRMVSTAEQIIFLGFYFHEQNMELLVLPEPQKPKPPVSVFATHKDRSAQDKEVIEQRILKMLNGREIGPGTSFKGNYDCKVLFQHFNEMFGS
jgi:hypothetical protein